MSNWSDGYISDIEYTYGYYGELNPKRFVLPFLYQGLAYPKVGSACELGFGQGLSTNIHAAASKISWWGTDFNPSQANFAQNLSKHAELETKLFDQSFEEFCSRTDLPDFDYIGMHGIWSWISENNRRLVVEFIRRKLKVGGVLYISYNTYPGWSTFAPMRELMTDHAEMYSARGNGIVHQIDEAVEFANRLLEIHPLYSRVNPQVQERLKKLKGLNRHYLAHEYFNKDWHPMYFASVAKSLEAAKVQYACSANYIDHIDVVNLTEEQQNFLNKISDPVFRQSVRDFMVNQQFRRDYWVKGSRKLSPIDQANQLREQRFILTTPASTVSFKVIGSRGEANLNQVIYEAILEEFAEYRILTIGELEKKLKSKNLITSQIIQAIMILTGMGHLASVQEDSEIEYSKQSANRLNYYLCEKAKGSDDVKYLASPVTGGGIQVNRFEMLFISCLMDGKVTPKEWAKYAFSIITTQGQKLIRDGVELSTAEDNLAELEKLAVSFSRERLPVLKALQIAPLVKN